MTKSELLNISFVHTTCSGHFVFHAHPYIWSNTILYDLSILSRSYVAIYAGAGIHVFRGASTGDLQVPGSLPNNGIVISLNTTENGFYFRFFCRSDSMMSNVGMLIGPDGTTVTTGDVFTIAHQQHGELTVENKLSQKVLTASDQGVYICRIPLQSGVLRQIEMRDINVGIYPSGFNSKYVLIIYAMRHVSTKCYQIMAFM